jgi:gluconate 5-dehydrogenase
LLVNDSLFSLSGKTALVTGSSRGLGVELALALAESGARVVLNGRDEKSLERTRSTHFSAWAETEVCTFDVADPVDVERGTRVLLQRVPRVDILVNNAGIQIRGPLEDYDPMDWDRVIRADLSSAFYVTRYLVKPMIERGSGKIINTCSLMSEVGRPTIAPYAAAKGGLKMLTRAMATEWARHGIQVNAIGPGYFASEMTRPLVENPEFSAWLTKRTPAARWGEVRELRGPVVFLASEASSFVNGHILYVDGGFLASA